MKISPSPKHLFDLLARAGLTHAAIAAHLGVSLSLVNSWSVGRRRLPLARHQQLIAYAIECHSSPIMQMAAKANTLTTCRDMRDYLYRLRDLYAEEHLARAAVYRDIEETTQDLARQVAQHSPDTWMDTDWQRIQDTTRQLTRLLQDAAPKEPRPSPLLESRVALALGALERRIASMENVRKKRRHHATAHNGW